MSRSPAAADKPDRRALILARSAEMFAAKGIPATTVRDIGEAAGVFPGSLYHWFRSKDGIVRAILTEFMGAIQRRFEQVERTIDDPVARIDAYILATLEIIEHFPEATAMYQNDRQYLRDHGLLDEVDVPARAVRNHWMRAIKRGVSTGLFRRDIPAEFFYRTVRDTLWSTTHWPARRRHSTAEFAKLMSALFLDGYLEEQRTT